MAEAVGLEPTRFLGPKPRALPNLAIPLCGAGGGIRTHRF